MVEVLPRVTSYCPGSFPQQPVFVLFEPFRCCSCGVVAEGLPSGGWIRTASALRDRCELFNTVFLDLSDRFLGLERRLECTCSARVHGHAKIHFPRRGMHRAML